MLHGNGWSISRQLIIAISSQIDAQARDRVKQ